MTAVVSRMACRATTNPLCLCHCSRAARSQAPCGSISVRPAASVTRAEFDAELLRIPADARAGVTANPRRVNDLLVRMLVQKTLAARARAAKLDESPEARLRAQAEIDRLLAGSRLASGPIV